MRKYKVEKISFHIHLTPVHAICTSPLPIAIGTLSNFHLTPAPLLKERGYLYEYLTLTPLLLKEKGPGDEVEIR